VVSFDVHLVFSLVVSNSHIDIIPSPLEIAREKSQKSKNNFPCQMRKKISYPIGTRFANAHSMPKKIFFLAQDLP
jgi:hypothetical protein